MEDSDTEHTINKKRIQRTSNTNLISRNSLTEFKKIFKFTSSKTVDKEGQYISGRISVHQIGKCVISKEDLLFENVIRTFKKNPENRNPQDIAVISKFLESTQLLIKLKKDNVDEGNLYKLLYFCAKNIQYCYFEEKTLLFNEGDVGDKFYIILEGGVEILRAKENVLMATPEEYFDLLEKQFDKGERHLFRLNASSNFRDMLIQENDLKSFKTLRNKLRTLKRLINKYNFSYESMKQFAQREFSNISDQDAQKFVKELNSFKKKTTQFLPNIKDLEDNPLKRKSSLTNEALGYNTNATLEAVFNEILLYDYYFFHSHKYKLNFYENEAFLTRKSGDFFGEIALEDKNALRTATVVCNADTHLGYVKKEIYREFIMSEKQKMKAKNVLFLIENFFFSSLGFNHFNEKYFLYFIWDVNLRKDDNLYVQDEEIQHVYFIKEGEIELSLNMNFSEITDTIVRLNQLIGGKKLDLEKEKDLNVDENIFKKKNIHKISISSVKQILGIYEMFYGIKTICTAKVTNNYTQVIKIERKKLNKLLFMEIKCEKEYNIYCSNSISSVLKRLLEIRSKIIESIKAKFQRRKSNLTSKTQKHDVVQLNMKFSDEYQSKIVNQLKFSTDLSNLNQNKEFSNKTVRRSSTSTAIIPQIKNTTSSVNFERSRNTESRVKFEETSQNKKMASSYFISTREKVQQPLFEDKLLRLLKNSSRNLVFFEQKGGKTINFVQDLKRNELNKEIEKERESKLKSELKESFEDDNELNTSSQYILSKKPKTSKNTKEKEIQHINSNFINNSKNSKSAKSQKKFQSNKNTNLTDFIMSRQNVSNEKIFRIKKESMNRILDEFDNNQ